MSSMYDTEDFGIAHNLKATSIMCSALANFVYKSSSTKSIVAMQIRPIHKD